MALAVKVSVFPAPSVPALIAIPWQLHLPSREMGVGVLVGTGGGALVAGIGVLVTAGTGVFEGAPVAVGALGIGVLVRVGVAVGGWGIHFPTEQTSHPVIPVQLVTQDVPGS